MVTSCRGYQCRGFWTDVSRVFFFSKVYDPNKDDTVIVQTDRRATTTPSVSIEVPIVSS